MAGHGWVLALVLLLDEDAEDFHEALAELETGLRAARARGERTTLVDIYFNNRGQYASGQTPTWQFQAWP